MSKTIHLTDENFEATIAGAGKPVLVDFTAAWCGPCKAMSPVIDKLAEELEGSAVVCKLDIDEVPAASSRYGIRSVPTVILFRDGKRVGQVVGMASRDKLVELVNGVG